MSENKNKTPKALKSGNGSNFVIPFAIVLIGSLIIFRLIKSLIGLRVTEEEEIIGLDIGEHEMESYAGFEIFTVE